MVKKMIAVTLLGFHNLCSPNKKFANMRKILFLVIAFHLCMLSAFTQVKVQNLLTENLSDPIGIDVQKPRFSWH
jgi:hypothetical protein